MNTRLAWVTSGLPFGTVEIVDEWYENDYCVSLAVIHEVDNRLFPTSVGALVCLMELRGAFYVVSGINDGALWEHHSN